MNTSIAKEVKQAYVKKIASGEISISEAAKEVGVSKTAIYDWRKAYEKDGTEAMPGKGRQTPEDAENDFLKKAAKYFAAE